MTACSNVLCNFWVLQQKVKESISSGSENCLDWTCDRHSWNRASAAVILPETSLKGDKHCCPNTAARSANNHHNNGNSTAVLWCLIILACAKYNLEKAVWHQRQNHRCDSDTDTTFCHNVILSRIEAQAGRKVTLSHTDRYNPLALAVF